MKYCETCNATYPTEFNTCPKDQTVLRTTSELTRGMVIRDKYQVEEKIGAGGMATVYRVKHLAFNEERAIKVVSSKLMDDPNFIKRFRTEAVVTRKLQHPNAVRVDDLDTTEDGRLFMVMEYVKGRDLRTVVAGGGPLPLERVLNVAWQVASALATAHELGITHRDIKPENILLVPQPDGKDLVKVLDFGIAKVREGAMDLGGGGYTATQTGMLVGTPQYSSPEQALGKSGEQIDGRAVLYSLGVVMYEMLTGKLPFESDTPMGLLLHHLQTPPTSPDVARPDLQIPPAVAAAVMKALEKDPAKRFQTAGELLDALAAMKPSLSEMASAATHVITPTVMAAAASAGVFTPTPRVGNANPPATPKHSAPAAHPKPHLVSAAESTVMLAPPKKSIMAVSRPAPKPVPAAYGARGWMLAAVIVLTAAAALAFVVRQKAHKAGQPTPPMTATTPVAVDNPTPPQPAPTEAAPTAQAMQTPSPSAADENAKSTKHHKKTDASPAVATTAAVETKPSPAPQTATSPSDAGLPKGKVSPEVLQLLRLGKQQYEHEKYGQAMNSFRAVLDIEPANVWAQRGIEACKEARQKQSEQVLQSNQAQTDNQQRAPLWRRRRPN